MHQEIAIPIPPFPHPLKLSAVSIKNQQKIANEVRHRLISRFQQLITKIKEYFDENY